MKNQPYSGATLARQAQEFDRFDCHFPGWALNAPSEVAAAGEPMQFHAGLDTRAKRACLGVFWALEFDDLERALMSRMAPLDVAVACMRFALRVQGDWKASVGAALDDPAAARCRRWARASLCAGRARSGQPMFGKAWVEDPMFDAFWEALPPDGPEEEADGALKLSSAWIRWAGHLARGARARRARQGHRAFAKKALEAAYPDLAAQGMFDDIDNVSLPPSKRWSWEQAQAQGLPARHWLGSAREQSGRVLLGRLGESELGPCWMEERATALRLAFELDSEAAWGERSKPSRL